MLTKLISSEFLTLCYDQTKLMIRISTIPDRVKNPSPTVNKNEQLHDNFDEGKETKLLINRLKQYPEIIDCVRY